MAAAGVHRANEDIAALKALVTETLQRKGILPRLKAELRSNVFAVLQGEKAAQQSQLKPKQQQSNEHLEPLKGSREGKLALDIISEFLEYYEFTQTMPIYTAETALPDNFEPSLRTIIAKELHLGSSDGSGLPDEPLLLTLIRQAEHRKPFVPAPSALHILPNSAAASSGKSESLGNTLSVAGGRPQSPTSRRNVLEQEGQRQPAPNIDLIPASSSPPPVHASAVTAAVTSVQKMEPTKTNAPAASTTTASASKQAAASGTFVPTASTSADKKPSPFPPLEKKGSSSLVTTSVALASVTSSSSATNNSSVHSLSTFPKPTESAITSISAAPPTVAKVYLAESPLDNLLTAETDSIPEDLQYEQDEDHLLEGDAELSRMTPPRQMHRPQDMASPEDVDLFGNDDNPLEELDNLVLDDEEKKEIQSFVKQ